MISIESTLKNHPNLSTTAFCVYYAIYEKIKKSRQNSTIYKIKDISALCGVSPKLAQRSVTQLHDEGLIIVEKKGRENLYSLPEEPNATQKNTGQNRPAKPKKQTKTTVESDRCKSESNNKILKNTNNINNQTSDNQIHPVYREYNRLCHWHGNLQRGRTEISPEDLTNRMEAITTDTLDAISAIYDRTQIKYPTAWIQAALLNPWATLADPRAALSSPGSAPVTIKKPNNKIHFDLERQYDFVELEEKLLTQQHARSQARASAL